MKNTEFKVTIDNKEIEFVVKSPSFKDQREAQKVYNRAFSDAVKAGSIIRARLDDLMKEQGLWDDRKEKTYKDLQLKILEKDKVLAKGGISIKVAKQIAIEMKSLRDELRDLISTRTTLDSHTAEGQADNARFNYLVSACVVYKDTNQPYFQGYEDYLNRSVETVAITGAQKLANMIYGLDNDFEKNLPENKFLKKYKFVNDNLEYIDAKGRLIDAEGKLIDDKGNYINEEGKRVDINGNLITDKGDYIVEFTPFLDDNGNPIKEEVADDKPTTQVTTTKVTNS